MSWSVFSRHTLYNSVIKFKTVALYFRSYSCYAFCVCCYLFSLYLYTVHFFFYKEQTMKLMFISFTVKQLILTLKTFSWTIKSTFTLQLPCPCYRLLSSSRKKGQKLSDVLLIENAVKKCYWKLKQHFFRRFMTEYFYDNYYFLRGCRFVCHFQFAFVFYLN